MPGAQAFAVNDPYAADVAVLCMRDKLAQRRLGLRDRESVQVDLRLHAIVPAAKLAQDGRRYARPVEDELFAAGQHRVARVCVQALLQHRLAVGAAETGARGRSARARGGSFPCERLDVPDRIPEQADILVVGCGTHATSAGCLAIVMRRSRVSKYGGSTHLP